MTPTTDMTTSPLDRRPTVGTSNLVQLRPAPKQRWVPSRFNARTVGEDGRLILWNTFSGAISIFQPKDRERVVEHLSRAGTTGPLGKVGEYLKTRGFLVPSDADEMDQFRFRYAREQWRSDLLELILLASEDCNFRCTYCYEKFKNGTMLPEVRQGIRAMVLQRAPQLSSLGVSWFGGEPLYGWEAVEELSPFFKDVAERHGIPQVQDMTTNAYLLTEERATKLLDWGCRSYQITVDGLPAQHDCKRVGRDGSATYAVIMDNLRSLKARDALFGVTLRINFDRENVEQLGEFLEVLSEDFARDNRFRMRFRAVGKWGGENDDQLSTCGVGEQRETMAALRRKADEVGLLQEGGIREYAKMGNQVCYAARPYNFIVGATGKLMKCTVALDELPANVVGQLSADGSMALDEAYMTKWVKPYFETDSHCQHCYTLPGCQGGTCPLTRIKHDERSCCAAKLELKSEMRYTLNERAPARRVQAGASAG